MLASKFLLGILPLALLAAPTTQTLPQTGDYTLGPADEVFISALHVPELPATPIRIDPDGNVNLPLVGRVHLSGLTPSEAESRLAGLFKAYVRQPEVSVRLAQMHSQPVSVLGQVRKPGVYQLQGRKTLAEILSEAGGLENDAGYTVKITRKAKWGSIPVLGAKEDPSGQFSMAEVSLSSMLDAHEPGENILIRPDDVVYVPRASLVYVVGEVHRPGGFVLHDRNGISVLKALSLSEGTLRTASIKNARILRSQPGAEGRREIRINLKKILAGKAEDPVLAPDDILFIPNSAAKSAFLRGLEAAINTGSGVAIWRL